MGSLSDQGTKIPRAVWCGQKIQVPLVKAMVFPIVMYGCESWTIKKTERPRIDALNCGVGVMGTLVSPLD